MGRGRKSPLTKAAMQGCQDQREAIPVSLGREGERDTQAHGLTCDEMWECVSEKLSFRWHFQI